VGGSNVELTSVAILVGKVELNESIPVDVHVDAFDVDGVAKRGIAARDEGITVGLEANVKVFANISDRVRFVYKAKIYWRKREQGIVRRK
jgi:hypothetical protein